MTNTTAGNKGNGELNQFPTIQTTMARLQDCKKGMYLQFGWRNDGKKFKILKVNKLSLNIDYTPTEEVWSIDIDDNKVNVYNSFIYKGSIVILLQNAYNAAIEYVKKRRNKQLELF